MCPFCPLVARWLLARTDPTEDLPALDSGGDVDGVAGLA
jgi:hypothetical protein